MISFSFLNYHFFLDQREEKEKEEEETKEENWSMFFEATWQDDFIYVWAVFILFLYLQQVYDPQSF